MVPNHTIPRASPLGLARATQSLSTYPGRLPGFKGDKDKTKKMVAFAFLCLYPFGDIFLQIYEPIKASSRLNGTA
jgi:hypothetical protein